MADNFLKNLNNVNINPATEGTLIDVKNDTASIVTKTATLITNTASVVTKTADVISDVSNIPLKKNVSMANAVPIAIASDQTVNVTGQMTFNTPSSPMYADDDNSLFYLRKIVKQLEPLNTMDPQKRQRIYVDGSSDMTIATTTIFSAVAAYDQRINQYLSRNTFADNIRKRLIFY